MGAPYFMLLRLAAAIFLIISSIVQVLLSVSHAFALSSYHRWLHCSTLLQLASFICSHDD
jgi:hypothetical protein